MPLLATVGSLAGLLASLLASEGPATDPAPAPDFQYSRSDPRASRYVPPPGWLAFEGLLIQLRVSNQLIRVFGRERPHAYGLDLQLGFDVQFWGEAVGVGVRPQTGYAFLHHADFASHASITGVGVCLLPHPVIGLCYTPNLVIGSEAGELSRGYRHGLSLEVPRIHLLALEVQHGVAWVGAAAARHELRGVLMFDLMGPIMTLINLAPLRTL